TELRHNASFIAQDIPSAVQLDDSCAHNALTEIFVRGTNYCPPHTIILRGLSGGGCQRIIGLKVDHWPHHHPHCSERLLDNGKLRKHLRSYTLAGLVSGIKIVSKRLDDMIGCDPDVSCALLNH